MKAKVGIYCDLGSTKGAGHFVRSAALGAALKAAGAEVSIAADFSEVAWAPAQAETLGLITIDAPKPQMLPELATEWDAAVIDSYEAGAHDLMNMPVPLVAIDDESLRALPAQLVINQNLSGLDTNYEAWECAHVLRGPNYALLRPRFATARSHYRTRDWSARPQRILLVLGGTDARSSTSRLATRALAELPNIELHVIAAAGANSLRVEPVPAGSSLRITGTMPEVQTAMQWADLVISAAGTTVWELCCLGTPMALVKVAANQDLSYAKAVQAGVAVGLGDIEQAISDTAPWSQLLDPRHMNTIGRAAWQLVDGHGAARVAEHVLSIAEGYRRG